MPSALYAGEMYHDVISMTQCYVIETRCQAVPVPGGALSFHSAEFIFVKVLWYYIRGHTLNECATLHSRFAEISPLLLNP